jgi:hypothetical protein
MISSTNIFDNLPDLAPTSVDHCDELNRYLSTDTEDVRNAILWWHERCATFPCLSCMALDYLSIPSKWSILHIFLHCLLFIFQATSIDVKCVFSQGRLLLSHVCSHLSVQSTCALLCLSKWSELDLVKDSDVRACLTAEKDGEDEDNLEEDWNTI